MMFPHATQCSHSHSLTPQHTPCMSHYYVDKGYGTLGNSIKPQCQTGWHLYKLSRNKLIPDFTEENADLPEFRRVSFSFHV